MIPDEFTFLESGAVWKELEKENKEFFKTYGQWRETRH